MMGSGKSTVGKLLAAKLKRKFFDCDKMIEKEQGKTVSEIFETLGVSAFRALEKDVIAKLMNESDAVIATGGGAVLTQENWNAFQGGTVVWLKSSPEALHARMLRGGARTRPLLQKEFTVNKITKILNERMAFYKKADITIESNTLEAEEVAEKIRRLLTPVKK